MQFIPCNRSIMPGQYRDILTANVRGTHIMLYGGHALYNMITNEMTCICVHSDPMNFINGHGMIQIETMEVNEAFIDLMRKRLDEFMQLATQ